MVPAVPIVFQEAAHGRQRTQVLRACRPAWTNFRVHGQVSLCNRSLTPQGCREEPPDSLTSRELPRGPCAGAVSTAVNERSPCPQGGAAQGLQEAAGHRLCPRPGGRSCRDQRVAWRPCPAARGHPVGPVVKGCGVLGLSARAAHHPQAATPLSGPGLPSTRWASRETRSRAAHAWVLILGDIQ